MEDYEFRLQEKIEVRIPKEDLVDNLRVQLQKLNDYTFTDSEWKRFFNDVIANLKVYIRDEYITAN